jgi:hypothetical protein
MASGFSLGAAIGATGKFPKLKPAEVDTAAQDRVARELTAIRSGITSDKNNYHNVYVNQAADKTRDAVYDLLQYERNRDPERVTKAYDINNELDRSRNFLMLQSKSLFEFEQLAEDGDKKGLYIPGYFEEIKKISKTATSEDDLFNKIISNPKIPLVKIDDQNYISKDGYLTLKMPIDGLKSIVAERKDKLDFEKEFSGKNIFNLDQQGVLISEDKNFTDKERTINRFKSIPINREEALKLKETQPEIKPENNAWDIGSKWFKNNPNAQMQYRSMLIETNQIADGDPALGNVDELYKRFYSDYVINNIPAKYENKDQLVPRYITNINVSTGQDVAPTSFSIGRFTTNYLGGDELATDLGVAASKEPDGVQVEIPQNAYIISLDTGKPEFRGTATKQMTVARIGVFPATRAKDPESGKIVLVPLTTKQQKEKDAKGEKYLMYPFALAVDKPLEIGVMPDLSKAAYAIPLYEPDADGNFVISTEVRRSKNGKGSPLLNQVISRGKWDDESLANWNVTFFNMMKGVKDQNDLK